MRRDRDTPPGGRRRTTARTESPQRNASRGGSGQRTVSRTPPRAGSMAICLVGHHLDRSDADIQSAAKDDPVEHRRVDPDPLRLRRAPGPRPRPSLQPCVAARRRAKPTAVLRLDGVPSPCTTAPSRHHSTAIGSQSTRCANTAANTHAAITAGKAIRIRPGRNHNACVAAMPSAKSHAAWKSGTPVTEASACEPSREPVVAETVSITTTGRTELCHSAYQDRRNRTTVSRWKVCGNKSTSVTDSTT